jgi:hypothetical protein
MLTQDLLCALFEYQPDGRLLRKVTTNPRAPAHAYSGSPNKAGYLRTRVLGKLYYNHHLVWFLHHGTWPPALDHINGNRADNRLDNLRICSQQQNMHNARTRSDSKTGVKGVNWRPTKNKFRARIVVDRKEISLGHYDTLEEAKQAVAQARTKYHGEFARHD